jgi:hypothetical protein
MSNIANIQELRDKLADIKYETQQVLDRLDSIEGRCEEAITPEAFERKLIAVFKAGMFAGRVQQYDSIHDSCRYNTKWVEIIAGDFTIQGDVDLGDVGLTEVIEENELPTDWKDTEVSIEEIDNALAKFKPEDEESNNETPES